MIVECLRLNQKLCYVCSRDEKEHNICCETTYRDHLNVWHFELQPEASHYSYYTVESPVVCRAGTAIRDPRRHIFGAENAGN